MYIQASLFFVLLVRDIERNKVEHKVFWSCTVFCSNISDRGGGKSGRGDRGDPSTTHKQSRYIGHRTQKGGHSTQTL